MTHKELKATVERLQRELSQAKSDLNKLNKEIAVTLHVIRSDRSSLSEKADAYQWLHRVSPDKAFALWEDREVGPKMKEIIAEAIKNALSC